MWPYPHSTKLANGSVLLVQREAEVTFAQLDARFGFTPSDRSQLKVELLGRHSITLD
jgi:hypothetical protein